MKSSWSPSQKIRIGMSLVTLVVFAIVTLKFGCDRPQSKQFLFTEKENIAIPTPPSPEITPEIPKAPVVTSPPIVDQTTSDSEPLTDLVEPSPSTQKPKAHKAQQIHSAPETKSAHNDQQNPLMAPKVLFPFENQIFVIEGAEAGVATPVRLKMIGDVVDFELQLSTDPQFSNLLLKQHSQTAEFTLPIDFQSGTYYLRVQYSTHTGASEWSKPQSFSVVESW